MNNITPEEAKQIAEEAYIYAFPMLMGYRFGYATFLQPASPGYRGPVNAGPFGKAVTLDHTFKDVITPNADTPYSFGMLDLRGGPIVLTVPEVTGRYYVMQLEDLFGCNDLFIGSRATGSAAGTYFLMGPTWEGEAPEGFSGSFRFETDMVLILGRTQLLAPDDQPALAEVMRQYRLEPYEVFRGGEATSLPPFDWPHWDDKASRDERFIGYLNTLLLLCQPVHPDETEMFERFASIGIGPGVPFNPDTLDDEQRQAIRQGIASAGETFAQTYATAGRIVNGWTMASVFGNREFYSGNYALRATAAQAGWGGNDMIEAFYPTARVDANGEDFDGAHTYHLRWESDPPVNAFWSLTIYDKSYDGAAGYLVKNPINRYLINSTTEGLVRDADGGLTITVQHAEPDDPAAQANWLPAPEGEFYLTLRLYWPKPETLDDTWKPPLVVRVD
jgi:hypothetical protein